MRLDKFLANQNIGSRKAVGALVKRGAVTVNGQAVKNADIHIDPESDEICVNGTRVDYAPHLYIMLHKPAGVLSASRDSRTPTVLDLLPEALKRRGLFPAGRLDKDTTGLLIITDDGDFAHKMLAPKNGVEKRYEVHLDLPAGETDIACFAAGIAEGGDVFAPAKLELDPADACHGFVTLTEGKYHEVKRLFKSRGKTVTALKRLSIGALLLDETLRPGEAKRLSAAEAELVFGEKL